MGRESEAYKSENEPAEAWRRPHKTESTFGWVSIPFICVGMRSASSWRVPLRLRYAPRGEHFFHLGLVKHGDAEAFGLREL